MAKTPNIRLAELDVGDNFKTIGGKYKVISIQNNSYECKCTNVGLGTHQKGDKLKFNGEILVHKLNTAI